MSDKIKCLIVDDESIALDILENHLSKIEKIELAGRCSNASEAFNMINSRKTDLIFLDINMPGISGISFAKSINKDIKIIFTTAYREYAIEGFNLHAVDYLLKPISYGRLLDAINNYSQVHFQKTIENEKNENQADFIFVKIDRKMHRIDYHKILWIESLSDYLKIETTEGTRVTRETISAIEDKLPDNRFIRVHRSFIISVDKIESYSNEEIVIQNRSVPISRTYKENVINSLEKYQ
ncbi:LytTR family DNA-binding domain-containing protein [Gramella sp. GC03-9]|uniref:LytTR family DNA-binding domain-containing protein n=1 Tax=Christiangramia oceanisediminis TaxID=2920386 RepID=A0A9X2KZC0_9FLAO|nr:LytTR family DNA-binding domain-containing protein [Gramella oceanisediminis]MCP9200976.1 LytTR family DNA-binding domain-containing protein [Gramella oceanisediminis]